MLEDFLEEWIKVCIDTNHRGVEPVMYGRFQGYDESYIELGNWTGEKPCFFIYDSDKSQYYFSHPIGSNGKSLFKEAYKSFVNSTNEDSILLQKSRVVALHQLFREGERNIMKKLDNINDNPEQNH